MGSLFYHFVHPYDKHMFKGQPHLILYSDFKRITVKIEKDSGHHTYLYVLVHPQKLIDTAFHRGCKQKALGIHRSSDISKNA